MKRKTSRIALMTALFLTLFATQNAYADPCTFVSPIVQVLESKDSTAPNGDKFCVKVINLSMDIEINGGNKWTYIHLWRTQDYHTLAPAYSLANGAPTTTNILGNNLLTLGLNYVNAPYLSATYPPDANENPRMLDASDGVGFTMTPIPNSQATHFIFTNIRIVTPGVCDPNQTFKGDAWSAQPPHGRNLGCFLPGGFTFATSDPTVLSNIQCAPDGQSNILNFSVTANGTGNSIEFQFDIYAKNNPTTEFNPVNELLVYSGTTTYTVTEGSTSPLNFTSSASPATGYISIPAIYPAPYSTTVPDKYRDVYIVVKNIRITNGGTITTIDNALVTPNDNICQALPVTFGTINAANRDGKLVVDWLALTEENVSHYNVEASIDGKTWKEIGRLASKAENGNSTATLSYQLVIGLPLSLAAVGFALILMFPAFKSRKIHVMALLIAIGTIVACTQSAKEVDITKQDTLFVRIAQYDKDSNTPQYSNIMKVIKE